MGGQDSKPKEEDIFLLEHISKMTLNSRRTVSYYFIHPEKEAGDHLMKQLRTYFKIDHFKSIKTLKQEMSFVNKMEIVKIIVQPSLPKEDIDYLIGEHKIYQIIFFGPNSNKQPLNGKIVAAAENVDDLIKKLNEKESKDTLNISSHNLLLVDKDTKLLNKYRLNYHCNTTFAGNEQALEDFSALAKHLFPDQIKLIQQFSSKYRSSLQLPDKNKFVIEWAFKHSFYWQLVSEITRNTTDPKKLAYVRLALRDLFLTIKSQFKEKKSYKEVYIVIDINEDEMAKLEKSQGKFILFTSFVKAYSNEKQANAQLKLRPQSFKFTVLPNRSKLEPSLDFGFIINEGQQPNVIFNIYNVFGISEINTKTRRGQILYGALAKGYLTRQDENRPKMSKQQLDLMRNYDYLEDMMAKVDSQATVLQLSGYYKESLQIYDKKVDFIRKTTQSHESMDKCIIKKADALRISGDFENAEKEYHSVTIKSQKMRLISLVHIAQLYLMKGQTQKFDKVIDQLAPKVQQLKSQEKDEYFKACNYIVIRTIKKGSFKSAQKMLIQLQTKLTQQYPNNLEGKPIVHDIYRSIATCNSKLGRHNQALGLLKDTLSWQLVCEGKTANVALTQTLIQTVSRSSGNNEQLEQSIARMSSLSEEIESTEGRMESAIAIDLNKSLINISI